MRPMFRLWRLKWDRYRANAKYERKLRRLRSQKPRNREGIEKAEYDQFAEIDIIDSLTEVWLGDDLIQEARRLDVEFPRLRGKVFDDPNWEQDAYAGRPFLSAKGRFNLRRKVDEEKMRRFEVKTLWVTRFWLPLLAALVGIIGALTGLVAVLRHR